MKRYALGRMGGAVRLVGAAAAETPKTVPPGDELLREYFQAETAAVAKTSANDLAPGTWDSKKSEYRRQLAEMLGLWPAPDKTDLKATITGTIDHAAIHRREAAFPVPPRPLRHRQPLHPQGPRPPPRRRSSTSAATATSRQNGVSYGDKVAYPALARLVRPQRLRLPDRRHAATRRDRRHPPRHLSREDVVVARPRLHARPASRRGTRIRALDYLETPPRGRHDAHRRHRPLRRRRLHLVGRRARRPRQGRRPRRRHHRPAEPRRRRRRRGPLRLHVHGQHLPLGLRPGRRPRRPAPAAHRQHATRT